jgi:hypothetical protein
LSKNTAYAAVDDPLLKTKMNNQGTELYDRKKMVPPASMIFKAEDGYKGAHYDHFYNFFNAIRNKKTANEDALFGFRAAAPALLCNDSYYQDKAVKWDPSTLKTI